MKFYGWQKLSYIDYPEKLSTLLFTGGCNFRCPFCHNPELVLLKEKLETIDSEEIIEFLKKRKGLLDGVAITGGEPLLHTDDLIPFAKVIKKLGFLLKVDTNGSFPDRISALKDLVDFWAIDFKTSLPNYRLLSQRDFSEEVRESLHIIAKELHTPYEIRTTLYPPLVNKETLKEMVKEIPQDARWIWQQFRPTKVLTTAASHIKPYTKRDIEALQKEVSKFFKGNIELRT